MGKKYVFTSLLESENVTAVCHALPQGHDVSQVLIGSLKARKLEKGKKWIDPLSPLIFQILIEGASHRIEAFYLVWLVISKVQAGIGILSLLKYLRQKTVMVIIFKKTKLFPFSQINHKYVFLKETEFFHPETQ